MRNTSVVLASMLALTSVSRALPLSMDKSSSERHIDDAGLRDSTLHRRLVPWLYTSRFGRKQMGGTVGAGFTLTGASLAMGGWYLNEGTKDMNHKTSDIKSKVSEAKQKELDREVDELWKHRGPWDKSPSAKSLDSRDEKDSVLYKRWSWGSEKTLNILKVSTAAAAFPHMERRPCQGMHVDTSPLQPTGHRGLRQSWSRYAWLDGRYGCSHQCGIRQSTSQEEASQHPARVWRVG